MPGINMVTVNALQSLGWGWEDIAVELEFKTDSPEALFIRDIVLGKAKRKAA